MDAGPIGAILDGLGVTQDLEDGDLIASALVITKVVSADGTVALGLAESEGLSWIEQNGLLESARQVVEGNRAIDRNEGGD